MVACARKRSRIAVIAAGTSPRKMGGAAEGLDERSGEGAGTPDGAKREAGERSCRMGSNMTAKSLEPPQHVSPSTTSRQFPAERNVGVPNRTDAVSRGRRAPAPAGGVTHRIKFSTA